MPGRVYDPEPLMVPMRLPASMSNDADPLSTWTVNRPTFLIEITDPFLAITSHVPSEQALRLRPSAAAKGWLVVVVVEAVVLLVVDVAAVVDVVEVGVLVVAGGGAGCCGGVEPQAASVNSAVAANAVRAMAGL
jgi:hypothetical protein